MVACSALLPRRGIVLQLPEACAGFRLRANVRRKPTDRYLWTRRGEYVHETLGHQLTIFSDPTTLTVPPVFLKVRPAPNMLFVPQDVVDLLASVTASLKLPPLRLSSLELAVDFAVSLDTFERLGTWLWAPRVRRVQRVGRHAATTYLGGRLSSLQTKFYYKREDGQAYARLEYTLRRRALRRLGLGQLADLQTADWLALVARGGRFVELDPTGTRRHPFIARTVRDLFLLAGVRLGLGRLGPRERRWAQAHLVPFPVQAHVEAAVREMSAGGPGVAWGGGSGHDAIGGCQSGQAAGRRRAPGEGVRAVTRSR